VEALSVLKHEKVDTIISDILMPRMDGYRFCYEVRASECLCHLPFIFYTSSYTSPSDEKLALEMGADKFLTKPAPTSEIIQALREVSTGKRRPFTPIEPSRELNLMKEYNQQLVTKLEQKNTELTVRNEELLRSEQKISLQYIEEKKTREQLLRKTAFFEAQVNSALDGIAIVDREGKKILQNQRMIDLWNIPREFANEADDHRQLEWITTQVKNPRQFAEKVTYLNAHPDEISHDELELIDGKFFYRYSAPVRGKDGNYYGRIWAIRDMTDRKRAEDQIAEQAAFLDKARDAILVRDLEGKILFWNKGAERMYGWPHQDVVGRNIGELLYPNPKKFEEVNGLTITQGEWYGELQHLTRDRREITIEARWTIIRDNEGHPKSVLAINTDITERKKIEAQFMRAQRMENIGTLAGGIAHDLNNILTPIMLGIEILKDTSDPKATKILESIEVSAKRGSDIVRQVLSFARGLEGARVEVQPRHLLRDLENIIKDTFPKNIRLRFFIAKDTWTILGDPTQVGQILLNLCVNARDAMPDGGSLTIDVENCVFDEQYAAMNTQAKAGRYVKVSVTDSGTGIPPDLLDKIFEPFFTTKELNKGTGLGLSTVMAIVKGHDGVINVDSDPGKGTTFKVFMPAMEISSKAQKEQAEQVSLPRGDGELILVVDDEASIRAITSETLQAFGYRVLTATDGADAVAVYAEHKNEIAVVLTDIMMPVMSGSVTIHALMRINPAIKVIATSGLKANSSTAEELGTGVKHFLTKPYSAQTLLNVIRSILDGN
jgi:PAS domain S-box-containing protein